MSSSECRQLQLLLTGGPPWGFRLRGGAGLWVRRVRRRSPAHAAGLAEGDRLLSLNGISLAGRSHAFAAQLIERGSGGSGGSGGSRGVLNLCVERWSTSAVAGFDWTAASSSLGDIADATWQDDFSDMAAAAADWFNNQDFDRDDESVITVQELPVPELPLRELLAEAPGPSTNGFKGGSAISAIPFNRLIREATPSMPPTAGSQRRRYADSAYAGTPGYPTVEERKRMARRVARSLTDPVNRASRGAGMFAGRRQRADKFTIEGPEPNSFDMASSKPLNAMIDTSVGSTDSRVVPLSSEAFLLPTTPKTVAEFVEQELLAAPKLTHADYDPGRAFGLAAALHQGKAGQVLEKRRQRAEKFVVEGFGRGSGSCAAAVASVADDGGLSEL